MSKQLIAVNVEYYQTLEKLANVAVAMSKRLEQCGYHDPSLAVLRGEAESHIEDMRDMEERGDI